MLKIVDNLNAKTAEQLARIFPRDAVTAFALFKLQDWCTVDGVWIQEEDGALTALLVQQHKTSLYVAASPAADFEELRAFTAQLGGMVVHCAAAVTQKIGVTAFSKCSLMVLSKEIQGGRQAVTRTDNLRPIFELVMESELAIWEKAYGKSEFKRNKEIAYKDWLAKTSRGIFNGYTTVKVIAAGENSILSAAIADTLDNRVYIRDVATDKDFRKLGYASDCVRGLCAELKTPGNEVFLACSDLKTERFYKELGFETQDYMEIGIVEL